MLKSLEGYAAYVSRDAAVHGETDAGQRSCSQGKDSQREADKAMRTLGTTKSCDGGNTTRCKAKVLKTGRWLGILHRFQVQLFHLSEMQLRNDAHSFDHGTQQFKLIYIYIVSYI